MHSLSLSFSLSFSPSCRQAHAFISLSLSLSLPYLSDSPFHLPTQKSNHSLNSASGFLFIFFSKPCSQLSSNCLSYKYLNWGQKIKLSKLLSNRLIKCQSVKKDEKMQKSKSLSQNFCKKIASKKLGIKNFFSPAL